MPLGQQYTNFCCRLGGSNLNAGTRTGDNTVPGASADFTYASGDWVAGTGVFTVASGNPLTDGVAVGDFASVYADGSTVTGFVGRVTARDATTITVSLTAKSGTAPTDGTGTRTLKIGGAWRGPDSTTTFPFAFIETACKDSTGRFPRINLKNDVTYQIFSPGVTVTQSQLTFQGFSTSYGDFGKATISGDATANPVYALIYIVEGGGGISVSNACKDLILTNNGDEGDNAGLGHAHMGLLSYCAQIYRCTTNHNWISSFDFNGICVEGECYDYDFGGSVNMGAWVGSVLNLRCIAHNSNPLPHPYDITGVNVVGFHTNHNNVYCVSTNIHGKGSDSFTESCMNCDAYNCDLDGFSVEALGYFKNCNSVSNVNAGFTVLNTNSAILEVDTSRYGTGTQANGSTINAPDNGDVSGYTTNLSPWVNADNGNFTLFLGEAFEVGLGSFTQIDSSYSGCVAYPDIGAARHESHVSNRITVGMSGGM